MSLTLLHNDFGNNMELTDSGDVSRPSYEIVQMFEDKVFRLYDEWQDDFNHLYQENEITSLRIGGQVKDISFLSSLSNLSKLEIVSGSVDLRQLENLSMLKKLTLHEKIAVSFDFAKLRELESLGIVWSKKVKGVQEMNNLRSLTLIEGDHESLQGLSALPNLERLSLVKLKTIDLSLVGEIHTLSALWIKIARKIVDISFLRKLTRLKILGVQECTGFHDLNVLSEVKSLEILSLDGVGEIVSLSPLCSLPRIKEVFVFGRNSTKILCQDYSKLLANPTMQRLSILGPRGFDWRRQEDQQSI